MGNWTADITTDPDHDHQLHVELLENDAYRARLYEEGGELKLLVYEGSTRSVIPVNWLLGIIDGFRKDLESARRGNLD